MLQVSIFVRIVLVTEWALAFSQATPTRHVNRTMPWTLPERDVCEDCPRSICLSLLVLCLSGLPTGLWALSHRTLAPYRSMIQVESEVFLHAVVTRYVVLGLWYIHSAISWRNVFSSPYLMRRLLSSRLPPRCLSLVQSSRCVRHGVPPRLAHILQHDGCHLREAILLLRSVLHVGSLRLKGAWWRLSGRSEMC